MKATILAVVVLLSCSGCAAQQVWSNPEKTNQQFYQDMARCEAMSNSAGSQQIAPAYFPQGQPNNPMASFAQGWNMGSASNAAEARDRIFGNCMRGEGWYLEDAR